MLRRITSTYAEIMKNCAGDVEMRGLSGNFRDTKPLYTENTEKTDEHGKIGIFKALSVWFRDFRVFRCAKRSLIVLAD